jgi:hypothetical protein
LDYFHISGALLKTFWPGFFKSKVAAFALTVGLMLPSLLLAQMGGFRHQLRTPNLILESRAYYGWTLDHHIEMEPFQRHYPAYEISLMKATYGRTRWEYKYNYPFIGVSYWYSGLGNTPTLGSAHAVFPFINFPLLNREGFNFYFRLGVGLAYLTKPYDRYENYGNLAIGSHLNGAVNLLVEGRWRMGRRFMAAAGVGLMHFSNGAIKLPNYGVNIPCAHAAVSYRLTRENVHLRRKLLPELYPFEFDGKKFLNLDLNVGFGVKDMQATLGNGNLFLVTTGYVNLMLPVSFKSRFGLGFDASYDASDEKTLEMKGIEPNHRINLVKTGINAAYELEFSRMSIMLNLGSYISGLDKSDGYVYEKLAIRVGITRNIYGSLMLKAHYAKADYITFGVGYRLWIKYYSTW